MNSMTGYAYNEVQTENAVVSVEIKSVNSRFLDLTINLPSYLNSLESFFRSKITEKLSRGKVDVYIKIKELSSVNDFDVDMNMIAALGKIYSKAFDALCNQNCIVSNLRSEEKIFSITTEILKQNGVIVSNKNYDADKYKELIAPVFEMSLNKLCEDRTREGENLKIDLLEKLSKLDDCALFFKNWQPKMEEAFKTQILERFNELLKDKVDENRVMTEVAVLMVKFTINEEIIRLQSHLKAMRDEITNNETPGKKLDFICQEINREINTIGSKNQFVEVGTMVITAKDSLENIREQAKNVE